MVSAPPTPIVPPQCPGCNVAMVQRTSRKFAKPSGDQLWKRELGGTMHRHEAYGLMQYLMRMSEDEAHIGNFSIAQCQELIECLAGLGVGNG